jgi:DNA-binding transcriptional LysR family regulator
MLALMQEAEAEAAGDQENPRGHLTVTASVTFGRLHVAPLLLEFLRSNPEVTGSLLLVDRMVQLPEEAVDLAFRIGELPDSSLAARRLGTVQRLLVASPGYLERRGRPARPERLGEHDLISFSSLAAGGEWRFWEENQWKRVGVRPRLEVNDAATAVASALAGDGITLAMSYVVASALKSGALEVVLAPFLPPPVPVQAVTLGGPPLPARIRSFLDFVTPRLMAVLAAPLTGGPVSPPTRPPAAAGGP